MTYSEIESSVIATLSHGWPLLQKEGCDHACLVGLASLAQINHPRSVELVWQALTNRDVRSTCRWLTTPRRTELNRHAA